MSRSTRRSNCAAEDGSARAAAPRSPSRFPRCARTVFPAVLALAAGACAIDNHGAVIGRITHADGAVVADIYAIGVHLKTKPGDTGLVLGYSRASYVFAETPGAAPIAEGWHRFAVPLPAEAPKALHLESVGASAHRNHSQFGMTLGYRAYTLLAWARADSNELVNINYQPSHPQRTRLRVCKEASRCADLR